MNPYLLVPAALALAGLSLETWRRARARALWQAPGQRIDVGGHSLHAKSYGAGPSCSSSRPTRASTQWGTLPERFADVARVIAYDRGGLGWSDLGPAPRDAETLARELHQLLRKLVPDPARRTLIVAHGTGAHIARMYAHRYPFEMVGLVLVDGHPDTLIDRLRREQVRPPVGARWLSALEGALARFGLLRLLALRGTSNNLLPLPARQIALLDALELDPRVRRGAAEELAAEERTLEQMGRLREATATPTHVLVAGATLDERRVPRTFPRSDYNKIWAEEGAKLARTSTCAEVTVLEDADHLLQLRAPDLVEQAIRGILASSERAEEPRPR
ncbi:MAG: alpha/beta hydrolase [Planctomycetota bacterium]